MLEQKKIYWSCLKERIKRLQLKMIANPEKFHAIFLSKDKKDNSNLEIRIGNKIINSEPTVKLLGVTIDHKLNFDLHVRKICKTASTQLNALFRF